MIKRYNGSNGARRLRDLLSRQIVFARLSDDVLKKLTTIIKCYEYRVGEKIFAQNSAGNDIYFILSGSVSIVVNGREVAVRKASQHFGEMSLIDSSAVRSASVISIEKTVIAKMKEADFIETADLNPTIWRATALELASRLRERNKYVRIVNPRPIIFIGSSSESLVIAKEIKKQISSKEVIVNLWSKDVFKVSNTFIESLEEQLLNADFAILVFGPDDKVVSRHRQSEAPRDNVILELGLFMGALFRERTFIISEKGKPVKTPTDLNGVMPLQFDKRKHKTLSEALKPLVAELKKQIKKSGSK